MIDGEQIALALIMLELQNTDMLFLLSMIPVLCWPDFVPQTYHHYSSIVPSFQFSMGCSNDFKIMIAYPRLYGKNQTQANTVR
ncbi:MAG: hypothetical protein ABR497_01155 [Kiritimatiellia bacterium]|nr:hypothetical protein [Lentisphaerota bacterium]